jgi:pimeloyl-ACP methyl ester carboxylesterase
VEVVVHCFVVLFMGMLLAALPATVSAQTMVPRWEPEPCGFQAPTGATVACGDLIVPEQRAAPTQRLLRLPVIKISSRSAQPAPDPIVYTAGGPGASSLGPVSALWNSPLVDTRDVILFEQRGTRFAEPALDCPELTSAFVDNLAHNLPVNEEINREVAAATACRERLLGDGIDLAAYNTAAIVADLQDLRRVLGYEQWNVFGMSYSTQVMQRLMGDDPQGVRSVLLDGAVPPTARWHATQTQRLGRSLNVLFARCAADPACHLGVSGS